MRLFLVVVVDVADAGVVALPRLSMLPPLPLSWLCFPVGGVAVAVVVVVVIVAGVAAVAVHVCRRVVCYVLCVPLCVLTCVVVGFC